MQVAKRVVLIAIEIVLAVALVFIGNPNNNGTY